MIQAICFHHKITVFIFFNCVVGSGARILTDYENWLLDVEDSVQNFQMNGPYFIFPSYIDKIQAYNGAHFCSLLAPLIPTDTQCSTYDSGFFQNGLRATQFRFVDFWHILAQQFVDQNTNRSNPNVLASYKYNPQIDSSSNYRVVNL